MRPFLVVLGLWTSPSLAAAPRAAAAAGGALGGTPALPLAAAAPSTPGVRIDPAVPAPLPAYCSWVESNGGADSAAK